MKVESIAEALLEHSAILLTCIKLPSVIDIFVWSIFKRPLKTGFTVSNRSSLHYLQTQSMGVNQDSFQSLGH